MAGESAGALSRSALLMLCARAIGSTSAADDVGGTEAGLRVADVQRSGSARRDPLPSVIPRTQAYPFFTREFNPRLQPLQKVCSQTLYTDESLPGSKWWLFFWAWEWEPETVFPQDDSVPSRTALLWH